MGALGDGVLGATGPLPDAWQAVPRHGSSAVVTAPFRHLARRRGIARASAMKNAGPAIAAEAGVSFRAVRVQDGRKSIG